MTEYEQRQAKKMRDKIIKFAEDTKVRDNWHEPDEQEVEAFITGMHLDNAMGVQFSAAGELTVHVTKRKSLSVDFNLADLLADYTRLARQDSGISKLIVEHVLNQITK